MKANKLAIRDAILSAVPQDGTAIGNQTLFASLQSEILGLSQEQYADARAELITVGSLGLGGGQGGSVYLIPDSDEDDEGSDNFEMTAPEIAKASLKKAKTNKSKGKSAKSAGVTQVLSYRHADTRVNNPEVGMVDTDNDPDQAKTIWTYDPHIDPALMFDSARGAVERLIDDALANGNADNMRDALQELRRMQAPYLAWTGKAERASFEVDTVSLHVHERVDPATILANARKRMKGEKAFKSWRQTELFAAPFENLPFRQALDFYHHEKGWSNRLIAGDSLLVMNSLLQKEAMAGKLQMIYIDPPYGIKYGSNF